MTDHLDGWPTGESANGYRPETGQHVFCYRPHDGAAHCGWVEDGRAGLFMDCCHRGRTVMTAALWNVTPFEPAASCRAARESRGKRGAR